MNGRIVPAPTYDVFISHASDDKEAVARPLAHALRDMDLEVWYDEFTLRIGSNLRQKIDEGIANSRFGVVVLSEAFFTKGWTNRELDGLVTRTVDGEQEILPIWHGLSQAQVAAYSASLANTFALSTSDYNIEYIAGEIAAVIEEANARESGSAEDGSDEENDDHAI